MAQLGLPSINIVFKELGTSAIERGENGVIALVLKKTTQETPEILNVYSATSIPADVDAKHKQLINYCLVGSTKSVKKVVVVFAKDNLEGVNALNNTEYNYLVTPYATNEEYGEIISVVGNLRDNGKMVKYIVANKASDKPYVINFTTGGIIVGGSSVPTTEYTCRIAGILASVPLSMSTTYQPLPEVESVQVYTKEELDAAIGNGELVIYNDGRKVKIARGVTSLVTTGAEMPEAFKKIKILAIADLLKSDIRNTLEDSYIGKYPCDFDHKCLLISAINSYLLTLEREMLLDKGSECLIDIEAQRVYLMGKGIDVEAMSDEEIKVANTGDQVFLKINAKILDAIEDIAIEIVI